MLNEKFLWTHCITTGLNGAILHVFKSNRIVESRINSDLTSWGNLGSSLAQSQLCGFFPPFFLLILFLLVFQEWEDSSNDLRWQRKRYSFCSREKTQKIKQFLWYLLCNPVCSFPLLEVGASGLLNFFLLWKLVSRSNLQKFLFHFKTYYVSLVVPTQELEFECFFFF